MLRIAEETISVVHVHVRRWLHCESSSLLAVEVGMNTGHTWQKMFIAFQCLCLCGVVVKLGTRIFPATLVMRSGNGHKCNGLIATWEYVLCHGSRAYGVSEGDDMGYPWHLNLDIIPCPHCGGNVWCAQRMCTSHFVFVRRVAAATISIHTAISQYNLMLSRSYANVIILHEGGSS